MITVEVYSAGTEDLVATLSSSGKGKKCTINAFDASVKGELEQFVDTILHLPKRGRAYPADRQVWMEALPKAHASIPYWFKIVDPTDESIEEVDDDNEEADDEEYGEDGDASADDDGETSDKGFLSRNG